MANIDEDVRDTNIRTNDTMWEGAVQLNKTDIFIYLSLCCLLNFVIHRYVKEYIWGNYF